MKNIVLTLKRIDWIIVVSSVFLSCLGLLSLYSSSFGMQDFSNFQKQGIFLFLGILLMFAISVFDYRLLRNDPYFLVFLWVLGVLTLAGLFFFAPEIRGVQSWYKIGGLSFDPAEFIKIVLIILMAKYFSMRHVEMYRIRHILLSGLYFAIPVLLIFFQPNLGSAAILVLLWIVLLLVSGIKIRHFLLILALLIVFMVLAWNVLLQDYQKARVISFLEPELDPLGSGWSQFQSKIAIGSGGIFGKGLGKGTQTQYGFLSEPQTDFIFASFAEEFGLAGVFLLLTGFTLLLWRVFKIGLEAQSNFPRLFATGFATFLILQFVVNIGMNLGLLPIIGLPLPLISYGGSSLSITYIALGILQSIKSHQ